MKNFILLMSFFYFGSAKAVTFSAALETACMNVVCDKGCQEDHILYAAAKRQCQESDSQVTLTCKDFELRTELNNKRNLSGKDVVDNPIDCSFDKAEKGKDLYSCESFQGSPYALLKLSATKKIGNDGSFAVRVDFKDTSIEDEPGAFEKLSCTANLNL